MDRRERGGRPQRARGPARRRAARCASSGPQDPAFPAIVAAGPNGAVPHHESSAREIGAGRAGRDRHGRDRRRLLLRLHPHLRRRRARRRGARGLRARPRAPRRRRSRRSRPGSAAATSTPSRASRSRRPATASEFGHGLGHGVGIEVHEAPRASKRSEDVLAGGRRGHGRARRLRPGPLRGPDRGPGGVTERRRP